MAELPDKARKVFEAPHLLFVAPGNHDGAPQVQTVGTHVENGNVTFNTAKGRVKERNLRRAPRIGLSITDRENPMDKVDIAGRVIEMIEGDEAEAQIDELSEKYIGQRPYPWRRRGGGGRGGGDG